MGMVEVRCGVYVPRRLEKGTAAATGVAAEDEAAVVDGGDEIVAGNGKYLEKIAVAAVVELVAIGSEKLIQNMEVADDEARAGKIVGYLEVRYSSGASNLDSPDETGVLNFDALDEKGVLDLDAVAELDIVPDHCS